MEGCFGINNGKTIISIINNEGMVVIEKEEYGNSSEIRLDVSVLSPGIYYVRISSSDFFRKISFIKI